MAILYTYPPNGETTEREIWRWRAIYNDGTQLDQFEVGPNGAIFHRSSEIDNDKLVELQLVHDTYPTIAVAVPPGGISKHFYRHTRINEEFIDRDTGEHLNREWRVKIWCIGFYLQGKKRRTYWLAYTDEHNHTLFSNDKQAFLAKALPITEES